MRPLRTGQQFNENRAHKRVACHARCWCESDNITLYTKAGNLSEGGMFLCTNTPLAPGSQVQLRLEPSPGQTLTAEAEVVWTRGPGEVGPPGMGLRFRSGEGLEEIRKFVGSELAAKQTKR